MLDTMFETPENKDIKRIVITKDTIERRVKPLIITSADEHTA